MRWNRGIPFCPSSNNYYIMLELGKEKCVWSPTEFIQIVFAIPNTSYIFISINFCFEFITNGIDPLIIICEWAIQC